ncbi:protein SUPPRESSOR OF K(+) TRANSPORT GROWTH DEFECT 1-like [Malania oleifera]|uniref:protein SUPPRESSOR OF K(+) TRANSPORT GROWTH DEFECT 1-like n=1 Tax=Malania oleifera TaxID=397392 RepID=UPI0025AE590E|nr:protein SUPPRESSOR OF K(+) TRANSPORT GROWTH DEFECT 1-like [Malania oleifera]
MSCNYKEHAVVYVKRAIKEDAAGNYGKALPLYVKALENFRIHLRCEKNPKIKKAITLKFMDYLRRAEEIRAVLNDKGHRPASNRNPTVATRTKFVAKTKDGEKREGKEYPKETKDKAELNSVIIKEKPNVNWSDVAGLESVKQVLQEAVILPVMFPQFFTGKRRPWSAFLLYGPPGTGKSYLAKAVATESDSTFFSVSSSDLVSKWMGESEKLISSLFQMARENAPSIIFIDEIDSLCGQRGEGNESEASRRIKTELLVQMQGVGNNDQKVLVLAATNTPYALDQAIRRRFDKRIYIPLPDMKARQHMFKVHLGDTPHNLTDGDFEDLACKTKGFSGSDVSVCVNEVLFEPVRKTKDAMFFMKDSNGMWVPCGPNQRGAIQITMQELDAQGLASKVLPPPVARTDFDKVLARQKPTVSKADLEIHEKFTKEFGEKAGCSSELPDQEVHQISSEVFGKKAGCFSELAYLEIHEGFTKEFGETSDCFSESADLEGLERFTNELGKTDYCNLESEPEVCERFKKEFSERAGCLSESEHTNDYGKTRLILNAGIAICILISSIPFFLR